MLTIMCGLPGSGKSTYLQQSDSVANTHSIVLSPDDFRMVLTGQAFYGPAEDSVWSHVKTATRVLIQKHHVIIDATHLTVGSRLQWVRLAEHCKVLVDCWWYNISPEIAMRRNKARKGVVPEEVMERMLSSFVPPEASEGFWRVLDVAHLAGDS